ncbi:MAG: hypothetical protein ACR2QC_07630 [Gammaproteobacteria bacterium]
MTLLSAAHLLLYSNESFWHFADAVINVGWIALFFALVVCGIPRSDAEKTVAGIGRKDRIFLTAFCAMGLFSFLDLLAGDDEPFPSFTDVVIDIGWAVFFLAWAIGRASNSKTNSDSKGKKHDSGNAKV